MIKKSILAIVLLIAVNSLFGTEIFRYARPGDCLFEIIEVNHESLVVYYEYSIRDPDRFFPPLYSKGPFQYVNKLRYTNLGTNALQDKTTTKYLVLRSEDYIFIFDSKNELKYDAFNPYFDGFYGNFYCPVTLITENDIVRTSSDLKEGQIVYNASNLITTFTPDGPMYPQLARPWIEGKEDYGIGEYFEISGKCNDYDKMEFIYISIGFVDFNKPWLYEENSRPKSFDVYVNEEYWKTIELDDTPDPQKFKMPDVNEKDTVRFVIKEVYEGTKYKDTCVNFITFSVISHTGYNE